MFSIFKQASTEETVLQELSEGQLAEVAGGYGHRRNDHDADDMHRRRHLHKHHHRMMHHKWNKQWKSSSSKKMMRAHW